MSKSLGPVLSSREGAEIVDSAPAHAAPRRRRRRAPGWLVLLPVVVMLGVYACLHYAAKKDLQEVVAELDRLEPDGWRLEELEAKRPVIPDDHNAALQVIATRKLFPQKWPAIEYNQRATVLDIPPEVQLTERQTEELRADLRQGEGMRVVTATRKLADMPDGRFPIRWSDDWISTNLEDEQHARSIINALRYDALLRSQDADADGACRSCGAILNVSRAMRDDPMLISFLIRCAGHGVACGSVERLLAQGQPSEAALVELQRLLEREERELSLLPAMRGERAGMDRLLLAVQAGKVSSDPSGGMYGGTGGSWERFMFVFVVGSIERNRAAHLRYMTRAVDIAMLPLEQQIAEFKKLEATLRDQPTLVRLFGSAQSKIAEAHRRTHAWLRCAIVMVAAERFRSKNGRWPESIDELVPVWISQVPVDPYNGLPLCYLRLADGVAVYSVYLDGVDNGGSFDRMRAVAGSDWGLRLWDVKSRRQAPKPKTTGQVAGEEK